MLTVLVLVSGIRPSLLTGFSEASTASLALRSSESVTVIALAPAIAPSQLPA